jgi:DNA-binding TFAR19-related protein (PDSD5 family)
VEESVVSEDELNAIRRKKLEELQKKLAKKEEKKKEIDVNEILDKTFKGRAWEVFNTASYQYPELMKKISDLLVKLVLSGKLSELNGEQLYTFLRRLGLRVRLKTQIKITSQGKLKSLSEKIKEDLNLDNKTI